jgi:hypothetical protein
MFGLFRRRSKADAAVEAFRPAIQFASEKWAYYCEMLPFRADVPLADRINGFMMPFEEGLAANFPAFRNAPPGVALLIAAKGIELSGSHSRAEIEEALGVPLPD